MDERKKQLMKNRAANELLLGRRITQVLLNKSQHCMLKLGICLEKTRHGGWNIGPNVLFKLKELSMDSKINK